MRVYFIHHGRIGLAVPQPMQNLGSVNDPLQLVLGPRLRWHAGKKLIDSAIYLGGRHGVVKNRPVGVWLVNIGRVATLGSAFREGGAGVTS